MVIVELKMVAGEAGTATKFVQSKIPSGIKVDGSRIEIGDEKGRDGKLLLHKFLHREGLDGNRVLSDSGTLKIVPDDNSAREEPQENDEIKGISPLPSLLIDRETPVDGCRLPQLYI